MADAVTTNVFVNGTRNYVVQLTNVSDGTGESLVKKVDISALVMGDKLAPNSVAIEKVVYDIGGFTNVILYWDRDAADEVAVALAPGQGNRCYKDMGGLHESNKAAAGTGDLLLTTTGAAAGYTYDITLYLKLKRNN